MSRKTRKLMWTVPLVAAVAVIGALAMFVMLTPGGALAHEAASHGLPGPVTGLSADPATDDPATGELEGRSAITLTWNAPDTAVSVVPTGYRIDYSEDSRVWRNLVPNLTEAMADAYCGTSAAADQRCYTDEDEDLEPNTRRYYRVFALSGNLTGPVSVGPTYDFATTVDYADPTVARLLTATTRHREMIDLTWQAPTDNGGAEVMWYCLQVGALDTDFPALEADDCLNVMDETEFNPTNYITVINQLTDGDSGTNPEALVVIVLPASATAFSHTGLGGVVADGNAIPVVIGIPDVLSLRYRLYAVTDTDGEEDTTNTGTVTDERRISMAASNTAIGRTRAGLPDVSTPITVKPGQVRNLRYVAYVATGNDAQLNLYWHMPANYPATEAMKADNWQLRVESLGPDTDNDGDRDWVTMTVPVNQNGTPLTARGLGVTQYTSTVDTETAGLLSGPVEFRVLYENNHDQDTNTGHAATDAIEGIEKKFTVTQINADDHDQTDLPVLTNSTGANDADPPTGLRFVYDDIYPTTTIKLLWEANANADNVVPTAYILDVSTDNGMTWGPLANVQEAKDLGATHQYRHHRQVPGELHTYRVFPEFELRYGIPQRVDASSQEDHLPPQVQDLTVTANGEDELVLNWRGVNKSGKHDVKGYLVQIASNDIINNNTTLTSLTNADYSPAAAPEWLNLRVNARATPDPIRVTVGADKTTYTYKGITAGDDEIANAVQLLNGDDENAFEDDLSASNVRWFRVIAITDENDGDPATGGTDIEFGGTLRVTTPSPNETLPEPDDLDNAIAKHGRTDDPDGAPDQGADTPPEAPVDLTAEKASNTNLIEADERGVLLLWNEPENAAGITSYVIERRINGGTELTIDAITWAGDGDPAQRTSYSDPTPPVDGEMLEYRIGSRGSAVTGTQWAAWIEYLTHPSMHMPSMPQMVEATATSDTAVTVSWMAPADNGGAAVTGYVLQRAYKDADDMKTDFMTIAATDAATWWNTLDCSMMNDAIPDDATPAPPADDADTDSPYCAMYDGLTDDAMEEVDAAFAADYGTITDTSYMDMGLMLDTTYYYRVAAMNAAGMGGYSDGMAYAMTAVSNTPPMAVGMIDAVTVTEGMMSDAMDVSGYFSDADMDTLTYTAASSDDMVATASVDGSMVTITGVAADTATITVTATDIADATATQDIMVTVEAAEAAEPEEVGPATGVTTGPFNEGGVIQVNWDPAPNATGYIIYAVNVDELDDPDGQIVVAAVNDAAAETINLGGLNAGDTYDIYVVATAKEMVAWPTSTDVPQVAAE